jgi:cell division protein FtsZ
MDTIRAFAADDATVIFGTVREEAMGDDLRVTVVATGLGRAVKKQSFTVIKTPVRTGTDNFAFANTSLQPTSLAAGATAAPEAPEGPNVWQAGRQEAQKRIAAMEENGTDRYDIPAFLRKQAD